MTTKQKKDHNGTAQPLDYATAQQVIQAAERENIERFSVELERLCTAYGVQIGAEPYFDTDGRTRARVVIRKAKS